MVTLHRLQQPGCEHAPRSWWRPVGRRSPRWSAPQSSPSCHHSYLQRWLLNWEKTWRDRATSLYERTTAAGHRIANAVSNQCLHQDVQRLDLEEESSTLSSITAEKKVLRSSTGWGRREQNQSVINTPHWHQAHFPLDKTPSVSFIFSRSCDMFTVTSAASTVSIISSVHLRWLSQLVSL